MKHMLARTSVKLRRNTVIDKLMGCFLASNNIFVRAIKSLLAKNIVVPEPPRPDHKSEIRLLIAPFNYAGQGFFWAVSAEKNSAHEVSAKNFAVSTGAMSFHATTIVPASVFIGSKVWHEKLQNALKEYTHVIIESFGSIFGRGTGEVVLKEIIQLQKKGIKVALLCHGSDIRSPQKVIARKAKQNSFLKPADFGNNVKRLQRASDQGYRVLQEFSGEVFVSTPDLLLDVPEATLLPVVIDPSPWEKAAKEQEKAALMSNEDGKPVVLHVPSNAAIKGTSIIDSVCYELDRNGLILYRKLFGIHPTEMPGEVARADIVIDQMLLGIYGVAACEAMAAGKVVVSHVDKFVRDEVMKRTGLELPIIEADKENLKKVLLDLLDHPEKMKKKQQAGKAFVSSVHTGKQTLPALSGFLGIED